MKILISAAIFFGLQVPCMIISVPIVAILLLTKWSGHSTIFGNDKWGRGEKNPAWLGKTGYLNNFIWLVIRNPVSNLNLRYLSTEVTFYKLLGNSKIGDKIGGGFYKVTMGKFWEYYYIKPYNVFNLKLCFRARIGWKIHEKKLGEKAPFSFVINPIKKYLGE